MGYNAVKHIERSNGLGTVLYNNSIHLRNFILGTQYELPLFGEA